MHVDLPNIATYTPHVSATGLALTSYGILMIHRLSVL